MRHQAAIQNQEENQGHERNEPQGGDNGYNGNNGRNNTSRPFIQPDDPHMFLEEFSLPPTVVQFVIRRPPIQASNFDLKPVTLQML